jgi:3-hydroxypropionate dehydrogenase (NADP+)
MKIQTVACVGAGLIGQGWSTLFCSKGLKVTLYDLTGDILHLSLDHVRSSLRFLEANNLLKPGEASAALKRIKPTTDLTEAVANADYVQESVPDNYEIKKRVFQEMDAHAPDHTILASSASGLLMTEIQKVTKRPQRCVLAHPMLPAHILPLVEIVGGEQTSPDTVVSTREFMKAMGKTPIVLNREIPGYIVNRLQAALLREAIDLVDKGIASAEDVDTAFCTGIGLRDPLLGPFLRIHLAGDGVERFFEHLSRSYQYRWETMETWTSIPPTAKKAVVQGVNEIEIVRKKTLEEIKQWRDEMLLRILKVLKET